MIKYSICRSFLVITLLMPASNAVSEGISFDYVQADYFSDTIDPGSSISDVEGDGIGFVLSLSFAPALAMKLAVAATTFDTYQGMSVDTSKTTALGVTAHMPVAQETEVFSTISAVRAEITAENGIEKVTDDAIGAIVDIGVRRLVTEGFEVELAASYADVFGHTVNSYTVDARLFFRKKISLGAGYTASDDAESLFLNIRMNI